MSSSRLWIKKEHYENTAVQDDMDTQHPLLAIYDFRGFYEQKTISSRTGYYAAADCHCADRRMWAVEGRASRDGILPHLLEYKESSSRPQGHRVEKPVGYESTSYVWLIWINHKAMRKFHIPAYDAIPDDEPLDEDEDIDDDGRFDAWA